MGSKSVIIQTAFLGDLLLAIPLIRNASVFFGEKPILICRRGFGDFFEKAGIVSRCVEIEKGNPDSYRNAIKDIGAVDFVLSPHRSFRSAWMARSISAKHRVSFRRSWNFCFYDKRVTWPSDRPDGLRQLSLLRPLDELTNQRFEKLEPQLDLVPDWAAMKLDYRPPGRFDKQTVFFAPGSVWNTKRWGAQSYSELGQKLAGEGYKIVLVGSPEEREYCESIKSKISGAENIAGEPSLYELGALFSEGAGAVTNDNGAMHLASTAGIPTVAIFGPTVLDFGYRPWNPRSFVVQTEGLGCRPCGKHGHETCPIGTHDCMKRVAVRDVHQAVIALLSRPAV